MKPIQAIFCAVRLSLGVFCMSHATVASDAIIVNADGTTQFNNTISGPNVVATAVPIAIGTATTLTAVAAGKVYTLSGVTADYTIALPSAAIGNGVIIAFSVAPWTLATKQYQLVALSGQTVDGRPNLVLIATNYVELISIGGQWVSRVKKVDTDWVFGGAVDMSLTTPTPPTFATSMDVNRMMWRRICGNCEVRFIVQGNSSTAGSTAGNGVYKLKVPYTCKAGSMENFAQQPASQMNSPSLSGWMTTGLMQINPGSNFVTLRSLASNGTYAGTLSHNVVPLTTPQWVLFGTISYPAEGW